MATESMIGNMQKVNVNYTVVFDFEKNFDETSFWDWIKENWKLSFVYSALYVIVIFSGKYYMENRPRFDLRPALALWSGCLAIFSILGSARTIPEFMAVLTKHGLYHSVCISSFILDPVPAFWSYMFTISKVYELGDTIFIVFRKQKLIFLHWYHHITVLCYSWFSYMEHAAPGRWFIVMNYTVHSFMYTYYCLRALKFRFPKWVNIFITSIQLMQMVVGMGLNMWTYHLKEQGIACQQSYQNLRWGLLMYASYFVLFAHFFYNTYLKTTKSTKKEE